MVTTGLIVRLEARTGKQKEVAAFLQWALPFAEDEPKTVAWFAFIASASSFAIVDALPDEGGRQPQPGGPVAAALIEKATELLSEPPKIEQVEVLAAKLPSTRPGP